MNILSSFLATLVPTLLLWNALENTMPNEYVSFLLIHGLLFPVILSQAPEKEYAHWLLWCALTLAHGLAHVHSHAFSATGDHNQEYDPAPDFFIHGLQCATIAIFHPRLHIPAWIMCTIVICAGYMAKIDKSFLETNAWIAASGLGVLGNHYQMMILEERSCRSKSFYLQSALIWFGLYAGYMISFFNFFGTGTRDVIAAVAWWDGILQEFGVFRIWMVNFGIAVALQRYVRGLCDVPIKKSYVAMARYYDHVPKRTKSVSCLVQ